MTRKYIARFRSALPALAGAAIAVLLVFGYMQLNPPGGKYTDEDIQRLAQEKIDAITPAPPVEPQIYAMLRPSVVLLTRDVNEQGTSGRGIGSGVVVDANGSILTAYHVVAGAKTVNVRFADGTNEVGTITQQQPEKDLAVVTVRSMPDFVVPATLGGGVNVGDKVLAIGSPFGLEGSLTGGIVSATGRRFQADETGQVLENMIQFDAAVNPGNSGGPLVDYAGRVVGIVSGILNPTNERVFVGLGFAVPIESAGGIVAPVG